MGKVSKTNYYTGRPVPGQERLRSLISSPVLGPDMRAVIEDNDHSTRTDRLHKKRQESRSRIHPMWGREGIRTDLANKICLGIGVVLLMIFLYGRINIWGLGMQNRENNSKLNAAKAMCVELRSEIEEAEKEIFVGYEAVDIGLVSDIGVRKETLVAPVGAIVNPQ